MPFYTKSTFSEKYKTKEPGKQKVRKGLITNSVSDRGQQVTRR